MKNMLVEDLCLDKAQVTLILESPHREEVQHGIPLAGKSGFVVSRSLLPGVDVAAGFYIKSNRSPFSIMNTFQYALQLDECMEGMNKAIGELCYKELGPKKYKESLKVIFSQSPLIEDFRKSYVERLRCITDSSVSDLKFVICGFIAQAFFEFSLEMQSLSFGRVVQCKVFERNISIMYVEHPSPQNNNKGTFWDVHISKNKALNSFVQHS